MQISVKKIILTLMLAVMTFPVIFGQSSLPEELIKNPLVDQLNYLENRTRIYENYRAIREDMFQRLKQNVNDSVAFDRNTITTLNSRVRALDKKIDSLKQDLDSTKVMLSDMTITKNSLKFLGMTVRKAIYNSIMWTVIAGLLALLVAGFLAFRGTVQSMKKTKKDLEELKEEFEAYRKTSREAREKMSMDHFNELRRLRNEQ
jgi:tetrahydromethanopterin S-methyltransferase subunit B